MFCPKCGHAVPDGAGYCPGCGEKVVCPDSLSVASSASPVAPTPSASPVPSRSGNSQFLKSLERSGLTRGNLTITIPMLVAAAVGTLMGVWLTIVFLTSLADVSDFMGMYHSTDAVSGTVVFAVLGILSCWCALDIAAPAGNYLSGKKPDAKKQMNRSLSACVVFFALCVFVCWSSPYIGVFSNDFVVIGITFYFNRFTDVMTSGLIFSLIAMVALIAGRVLLAQGSQK